MFKKCVLAAVVGSIVLPLAARAEDAPAAPPITGNFSMTSNYVFRGISQTMRNPAVQGGFDYAHASGLYLGTWGSNVSGIQYGNANLEWDFYGGYAGKINEDTGYNVGAIHVVYPDGVASTTTKKKWDTTEIYGGVTWKWINVKASYSVSSWYGIDKDGFVPSNIDTTTSSADDATSPDNSKGSLYLEANLTYELPQKVILSGHFGHQKINHFKELDYSDWKLGILKDFSGFVVGLAYTDTNAKKYDLYYLTDAKGDQVKLGEGAAIISVTKTF
ncbi:MAG: TorF family putative porin [Burkholderiales bacterium]